MLYQAIKKLLYYQEGAAAIIKAVEFFHHYLNGGKFPIQRDHDSLTWLLNFKTPTQLLQKYDF